MPLQESAKAAMARGIEYLLARQGKDGFWRDFHTPAGEASAWPTAYVGHALGDTLSDTFGDTLGDTLGDTFGAAGVGHEAVDRAADALARCQQPDGGWGYNEDTPSDADSTAWSVLFLARLRGRDRIRRCAGACLANHQRARNGGVATYAEPAPIRRYMGVGRWMPFFGWCRPQIEVSAVAGRAFRAIASDDFRPRADAAWRFVRSRQNDDGSWDSYWWTSSYFATAQAVSFALTMGDQGSVGRATLWTQQRQRPDGAWGVRGQTNPSPFATALALSVLAVGAPQESRAIGCAIDALVELQQADGGWPSDALMRIPVPPDPHPAEDHHRRLIRFGPGIVTQDQHRTFTTTTCVAALATALRAAG